MSAFSSFLSALLRPSVSMYSAKTDGAATAAQMRQELAAARRAAPAASSKARMPSAANQPTKLGFELKEYPVPMSRISAVLGAPIVTVARMRSPALPKMFQKSMPAARSRSGFALSKPRAAKRGVRKASGARAIKYHLPSGTGSGSLKAKPTASSLFSVKKNTCTFLHPVIFAATTWNSSCTNIKGITEKRNSKNSCCWMAPPASAAAEYIEIGISRRVKASMYPDNSLMLTLYEIWPQRPFALTAE